MADRRLPTGVVTFVLTDIVGSTRLWEVSPGSMDACLVRHEEIVLAAVEGNGGVLLRARGEGDSTFSVFERASDAVAGALAAQAALLAEPWPSGAQLLVRFAVHTGEAITRDGDYWGTVVNRAARLRSAAVGGQVLVGGATAALVVDHLPPGVRLIEQGEVRLKDLDRAEPAFVLEGPGLTARPLLSAGSQAIDPARGLMEQGVTSREAQVLQALRSGSTNAEIAALLEVSERTVQRHVSSLLRKLQQEDRRALRRVALGFNGSLWVNEPPFPPALELAATSSPLLGRQAPLDELRGLWRHAVSGCSRVVLVAGEAGIGKTRLVAELAVEVRRMGGAVLLGSWFEDDQTPYSPFVQLLEADLAGVDELERRRRSGPAHRVLSRIIPGLLGQPPPGEIVAGPAARADLVAAISGYLGRVAEVRPTLLVLEDLHWSTTTGRDVLRHLARSSVRAPLMAVVTCRDTPPDMSDDLAVFVGDLSHQSNFVRIDLRGLDEAVVSELAGDPDLETASVDANDLYRQTGGNPLLVRETLAGSHVGTSVRALLSARSRRLAEVDNSILDVAAVFGVEFDVDLLAVAANTSVADVLDVLERGERVGLVRAVPGSSAHFTFVHDLFRSIRYEGLTAGRRMRLHRQAATALETRLESDAVTRALAWHACESAPLGGAKEAIEYACRAGDIALASMAFEEATGHYQRALEIVDLVTPPDESLRCDITVRLVEPLAWSADPHARAVLEQAAQLAQRSGNADLLAKVVWAMCPYGLSAGRANPLVVSLAETALAGLGDAPSSARARVLTVLAAHSQAGPNPERRHSLMTDALEQARSSGDPITLGHVLRWVQWAAWTPDNLHDRTRAVDELAGLAETLNEPIFCLNARASRHDNFIEAGDVTSARDELIAIERLLDDRHDDFGQLGLLSRHVNHLILAGNLNEAERAAADLQRRVEELRTLGRVIEWGSGHADPMTIPSQHLITIRIYQDRIGELLPLLIAADQAHPSIVVYKAVTAMALARLGQRTKARTLIRQLASMISTLPRHLQWYPTMASLAHAAAVTGDANIAAELADQLTSFTGRLAVHGSGVSVPVDITLAQLALAQGHNKQAALTAAKAAATGRHMHTPILTAWAIVLEVAGRSRLGEDPDELRALVDEAVAIADHTGAALIREEIRRYHLPTSSQEPRGEVDRPSDPPR